jgi:hypothetical protein
LISHLDKPLLTLYRLILGAAALKRVMTINLTKQVEGMGFKWDWLMQFATIRCVNAATKAFFSPVSGMRTHWA